MDRRTFMKSAAGLAAILAGCTVPPQPFNASEKGFSTFELPNGELALIKPIPRHNPSFYLSLDPDIVQRSYVHGEVEEIDFLKRNTHGLEELTLEGGNAYTGPGLVSNAVAGDANSPFTDDIYIKVLTDSGKRFTLYVASESDLPASILLTHFSEGSPISFATANRNGRNFVETYGYENSSGNFVPHVSSFGFELKKTVDTYTVRELISTNGN